MPQLSVNVNKIATLRNQRLGNTPDVLALSEIALKAGGEGITIHPRPDERHIRYADIAPLRRLTCDMGRELNIEGNPFEGRYLEFVQSSVPDQATLVPDTIVQQTSDHGFSLDCRTSVGQETVERLIPIVALLQGQGIRVSLFIDPNPVMIAGAKATGADCIELYTEGWAKAFAADNMASVLSSYVATAQAAQAYGLGVNAGHDLNLQNLRPFLEEVTMVQEVSIGQALVADALMLGMAEAVRCYRQLCHL